MLGAPTQHQTDRTLLAEAIRLAESLPPRPIFVQARHDDMMARPRSYVRDSHEFWQFRPYQPGDSTRHIDWRKSGRGDDLIIREHQRHDQPRVKIWLDPAPGLDFSSDKKLRTKRAIAQIFALALTHYGLAQDMRISIIGSRPHPIARTERAWPLLSAPSVDLEHLASVIHARDNLIILSDFWQDLTLIKKTFNNLQARLAQVIVLQIADPAELDLPYHGRIDFLNSAAARHHTIDSVAAVRDRYKARLHAHLHAIESFARACGWRYALHRTDAPLDPTIRRVVHG